MQAVRELESRKQGSDLTPERVKQLTFNLTFDERQAEFQEAKAELWNQLKKIKKR